jgi:dihydrofolate reductase
MRKLKLEMQVSLDVYAADTAGHVDWMVWSWGAEWGWDEALRRYHTELTTSSDCLLLSGRMVAEGFLAHWARVAQEPGNPQAAFARPIVDMRKVVFSRTLERCDGENVELARGDLVETVKRLKAEDGQDILVYGGATFASALMNSELIDELHLFVNPVALGCGRPMFKDLSRRLRFSANGVETYPCGVSVARYSLAPITS